MNNEKEAFAVVYNAYHEKVAYQAALEEYERKGYLQRLAGVRPKDPVPGVSSKELSDLASFGFKEAFPELNSCIFFNYPVEFIKLKSFFDVDKGLDLFIHESMAHFYYSEKIPFSGSREMAKVSDETKFNRPFGIYYSEFFKDVDAFLSSGILKERDVKVSSVMESVSYLRDLAKRRDKQDVQLIQEYNDLAYSDVLMNPYRFVTYKLSLMENHGIRANYDDFESRRRFFACMAMHTDLKQVNSLELYNEAKRLYLRKLKYPDMKRPALEEVMRVSEEQERLSPSELDKPVSDRFVGNALDAGYTKEEISAFVDKYLADRGFGPMFRPAYDIIETKVADTYVRALVEQTEAAFDEGVRDSSSIEIQTPFGRWQKSFEQVSELVAARDFIVKNQEKGGYKCYENGFVYYGNGISLGQLAYDVGGDVSLKAVAEVSGHIYYSIRAGYLEAMGRHYASGLQGVEQSVSDLCPGAKCFVAELESCLEYLSKENKFLTVGEMLFDCGVNLKDGNCTIKESISKAVKSMYGQGTAEDMNVVNAFRRKYSDVIVSVRLQKQGSGITNKNRLNSRKGFGV